MHVCLLTEVRIFESALGGVPKFILSFAHWLLSKDVEITLVGSTFKGIKAEKLSLIALEEKIQDLESKRDTSIPAMHPHYLIYMLSRVVLIVLWIIKIISMHKRSKFSLIHSQDTGYSGFAAVICGKILNIPVIVSAHGSRYEILHTVIEGRLRRLLLRIEYAIEQMTINLADYITVANPLLMKYYSGRVKHSRIQLFPVPIKLEHYSFSDQERKEVRAEFGIVDEIVIGYVGRFVSEKNLMTLIKAFNIVTKNKNEFKMVLAGAGKLKEDLVRSLNTLGLSNHVIFCGMRKDINRILSSFDIFVLPSYTEGLSVSLLEAMACERPIICSDIPANRFLLTSKEAIFVNPYDTSSLAKAFFELSSDPVLRERMGKSARLRVREFDEDHIYGKILDYYSEISRLGKARSNS